MTKGLSLVVGSLRKLRNCDLHNGMTVQAYFKTIYLTFNPTIVRLLYFLVGESGLYLEASIMTFLTEV